MTVNPIPILLCHHLDEPFSGSDLSLFSLASGLDRTLFTPIVAIPPGPMVERYRQVDISVREVRVTTLRRSLSPIHQIRFLFNLPGTVSTVRKIIRREGIRLAYVNTSLGIPFALAASTLKVPLVWHVRELRNTSPYLIGLVRRWATRIVTNSHAVREGLGLAEAVVVHNGVADRNADPPGTLRKDFPELEGHPLVILAARIDYWKGHSIFLEAAHRVHIHYPDARFVIVGGPVYSRPELEIHLKEKAKALGIADVTVFTGGRPDVAGILREASVVICPSTDPEPFGRVVVEAMEAGRPVIASDHGGHRETVVDNVTGYLVPPSDPKALSERIARLLSDPELSAKMGAAARARYEELFTIQHMVKSMESVFLSLLQKG